MSELTIHYRDIKKVVQFEKGAGLLMEERGIAHDDMAGVYLAGAFGNSVNRDSAAVIGLIPNVNPDRVFSVGNAAGGVRRAHDPSFPDCAYKGLYYFEYDTPQRAGDK